ncbi:MAG: T9SS type A sorting domain-containing protein, partial [Bacteroidales bacterium]|nr:T9SS type A sorting domain-containing protein [Bacteroidales bacterium]
VSDRTNDGYQLDKVLINNAEFSGREFEMKDYLENVSITAVYSKIESEDLYVADITVETGTYCAGGVVNLSFRTNAAKYQVLFYENIATTDFEPVISPQKQNASLEIPKTTKYGNYQGFIRVADNNGNISKSYPFDFSVGYPNDIIETKYSDLICVNNFDNKFTAYQWIKNGREIIGANKQFFIDYPMLSGVYGVIVTDRNGDKFRVCDYRISDLQTKKSAELSVKVYPNPAKASQPVTVKLKGLDGVEKCEILIFNQLGALVYRISNAQSENIIHLKSGVYNGAAFVNGKKLTFKFIIND